mmetsp:Transcript_21641/g.64456  ORF Transcript_21641/g.64456 Transcript_21641/m.64456 type:complete len:302 (+) Transcript_21641:465-1370(+)
MACPRCDQRGSRPRVPGPRSRQHHPVQQALPSSTPCAQPSPGRSNPRRKVRTAHPRQCLPPCWPRLESRRRGGRHEAPNGKCYLTRALPLPQTTPPLPAEQRLGPPQRSPLMRRESTRCSSSSASARASLPERPTTNEQYWVHLPARPEPRPARPLRFAPKGPLAHRAPTVWRSRPRASLHRAEWSERPVSARAPQGVEMQGQARCRHRRGRHPWSAPLQLQGHLSDRSCRPFAKWRSRAISPLPAGVGRAPRQEPCNDSMVQLYLRRRGPSEPATVWIRPWGRRVTLAHYLERPRISAKP